MNHIVLVNIENDTGMVKRQFSPPFGLLIAASVLLRNNVGVVVRHIINTKESIEELMSVSKGALAVGFSVMRSPNILAAIEASEGWKIPKSNEEWAKYNRSISISEAGFISQEHINILQKRKIL